MIIAVFKDLLSLAALSAFIASFALLIHAV